MLPDRPPQVSFDCEKEGGTCAFQFWIGKVESFYCALDNCTTFMEIGYNQNVTDYACDRVKCSCIPGKMLCGEEGSIGMSNVSRSSCALNFVRFRYIRFLNGRD